MKNRGVLSAYFVIGCIPVLLWFWHWPLQYLVNGNKALGDFLRYVPVLVLAGAGVMGFKLNQTRVLLSSFICLALYFILHQSFSLFAPGNLAAVQDVLFISVPLIFSLTVGGHESPLMDRRFVRRLLLAGLPLLVLGGSVALFPSSFQEIVRWAPGGWNRPFGIPWISVGTIALYGISVWLSHDRRIRWYVFALGLALIPIMVAIRELTGPNGAALKGIPEAHITTAFLAVSIILFHAVFSMYWHRVYLDDLTGVPNRRALEEELQNVGGNYALAMIDIDHFKEYNDRFGHEEGDNVLRMVASHLENELASRVYRYGGEEFCALWRRNSIDGAFSVMEKARISLEKRVFHVRAPRNEGGSTPPDSALGVAVGVTISAGVAVPVSGKDEPEKVLRRADEALYEAKRTGRNCTVIAG